MTIWIYTLVSVAIVSLISIVGVVTLIVRRSLLSRILLFLVSFAVGGLFGDAFFHLLPAAFKNTSAHIASFYVLFGIVIFFALEKFVCWRHCHADPDGHVHPIVTMNLIGDTIHNFIDGLLIGASYAVSIPIGIATTIAVILHEIPQELGDFGVFLHGGCSVRRAIAYNFLSALTSVAGAIVVLLVGQKISGFADALVPIAAGGFIYIAGSDLIPELKHVVRLRDSLIQLFAILIGISIMALLLLMEH